MAGWTLQCHILLAISKPFVVLPRFSSHTLRMFWRAFVRPEWVHRNNEQMSYFTDLSGITPLKKGHGNCKTIVKWLHILNNLWMTFWHSISKGGMLWKLVLLHTIGQYTEVTQYCMNKVFIKFFNYIALLHIKSTLMLFLEQFKTSSVISDGTTLLKSQQPS